MNYQQQHIVKAFQLYTRLASFGFLEKEDVEVYLMQGEVQSLLEQFAWEVDAVLIPAGDLLYLVPITSLSPFHLKNEHVRRELGNSATNSDVYMMYFCLLAFLGEFYNSFHSTEVQRDFLSMDQWLITVNERMDSLRQHGEEVLQQFSNDLQYNWLGILEKWDLLNDLKESASSQKGNTASRLSFLHKVAQFMLKQNILTQVGPDEYTLTEKSKVIVQRYFMELDYNRGILQFMYQYDERKDE